jgi:hypothetical protein
MKSQLSIVHAGWIAVAALLWLLAGAAALAAEPASITAIDARSGIVTARGAPNTFTLQFKVTDAALLKSLQVGQVVRADLGAKKVSVYSASPCCGIVGMTGQASMNAPGDPFGGGGPKTKVTKDDFPNCSTCRGDCKVCTDSNMECRCTQIATGSSPGPEDDLWSCHCTGSEPKIPGWKK